MRGAWGKIKPKYKKKKKKTPSAIRKVGVAARTKKKIGTGKKNFNNL